MARIDESTLASLLLTSRLVPDGPPPLKAREFWTLVDSLGGDPAVLLGGTSPQVDDPDRIRGLLDRATAFAFALEDMERSGINILSALDPRYPVRLRDRLGNQAPPVLHVAGPIELLAQPGVAIVGSRDVGAVGGDVAKRLAIAAVNRDLTVISGGARGVDQLAMGAALDAGGRTVGVLAESLTRRVRDADVRRAIHENRLSLATPYKPGAPFSVGAAMGRNKLVYALATVTLVVATDENKGGTWAGATEALNKGYGHVAVWTGPGEGPGNAALHKRGAIEVTAVDDLLDSEVLFEPPTLVASGATSDSEQLGLGL